MQRVLILSMLVVGAFAGLFSSSNDADQLQRRHQRQQPQKIQQCACPQQSQYFNDLKQTYNQCQQQCQQQAPTETQQQIQQTRDCFQHLTRQMQQNIECIDNKLQQQPQQQQKSCAQQQQQTEQIQNEDASAKLADHFERTADNIRQQMEEAYEQQQPENQQQNQQQNQQNQQNQNQQNQQNQNQQNQQNQQAGQQQQKFGKAFANQVVDCTNKCFVQKVRQQDNSQTRGCEFRFENEQLKQAVGECQQKHIKQAVENVCQCATAKGQQGAEEFCQNLKEKKFEAEQLFKQY